MKMKEDYRTRAINLVREAHKHARTDKELAKEKYKKAAIEYQKAIDEAVVLEKRDEAASLMLLLGECYEKIGDFNSALECYNKSKRYITKAIPNLPSIAERNQKIGEIHLKLGNNEKAKNALIEAIKYYEQYIREINEQFIIGKIKTKYFYAGWYSMRVAECYGKLSMFDNLEKKYLEAISHFKKYAEKMSECYKGLAYEAIGSIYAKLGEYENALKYYNNSSEMFAKCHPETHSRLTQEPEFVDLVIDLEKLLEEKKIKFEGNLLNNETRIKLRRKYMDIEKQRK